VPPAEDAAIRLPWRYESAVSSRDDVRHERPQNPLSRIAYLLASYRGDSTYALATPHHAEVSAPFG
jgi:hypothetical protein